MRGVIFRLTKNLCRGPVFPGIVLCVLSIAVPAPAMAQDDDGFGAGSGGESAEGTVVPDYLGPASRAALDRIATYTENMQAARGLMVYGVIGGAASPEGAAAALAPGPDPADALSGLSDIERRLINDEITMLEATENLNDREQEFWDRVRDAANGEGMGSSSGEPHIVTFDDRRYGFQAAGEFTAAKGEGFEVQLRFAPWKRLETATVNTAAAFRLGADRVTVTYGVPLIVRINGEETDLHNRAVALEGGGVVAEKNGAISLIWPDFSTARVTRAHLGHLDVWLRLAPGRRGAVKGLMGDFDGRPGNDLRLADGQVLTVPPRDDPDYRKVFYETFRNAWKVSAESSLFDYEEGQSVATFDRPEIPPVAMSVETLNAEARSAAEQVCRAAGFNDEGLYRQCVFDVGLTGEAGFAVSALGAARRLGPDELRRREGTVIRGSIDGAGAVDRHPIEITEARTLFFVQEKFDPALDLVQMGLYTQDDRPVGRKCFGCGELGLVSVKEPGTYVFQAGTARDKQTGSYRVRYWLVPAPDRFDIAPGDLLAPGRPARGAGRIEVPGSADEYRFTVDAPTTVNVAVASHEPALGLVWWQLLDAEGKRIEGTCLSCGSSHTVRLDAAGQYTLRVGTKDRDRGTGAYAISVSAAGGE